MQRGKFYLVNLVICVIIQDFQDTTIQKVFLPLKEKYKILQDWFLNFDYNIQLALTFFSFVTKLKLARVCRHSWEFPSQLEHHLCDPQMTFDREPLFNNFQELFNQKILQRLHHSESLLVHLQYLLQLLLYNFQGTIREQSNLMQVHSLLSTFPIWIYTANKIIIFLKNSEQGMNLLMIIENSSRLRNIHIGYQLSRAS